MISFLKKKYSDDEVFSILEPSVRKWFKDKFKSFTEAQRYAVKEIHENKNVLISSPTGSGKTLSAFLAIINELVALDKKNELKDEVYCIYVSPLKALNRDVEKNLLSPLSEIEKVIQREQDHESNIRVGVRTGDTETKERSKQLRKPPHIFITTPESLAIMLNSPRMNEKIKNAKYVVIDEIHSLCENKRGTHLSLSLERLQYNAPREITRIGLSATIAPIKNIANFLVGNGRDCLIADVNYNKETEITVSSPVNDFIYSSQEKVNKKLYSLLDGLIQKHRTTIIFTNTRSGTERVLHALREKYPKKYTDDNVGAHHSSLSKEVRYDVEEKLKNGDMKVVVSSTSLELGIDIGYVDQVILLTSPKSVARALQRIGRSGHALHEKSKGVLVVMDRDDLVECIIMAHAARNRIIDKVHIPTNCLDVLSQHVIGMSLDKEWGNDEAYYVVTKAFPYKDLTKTDFQNVLEYLGGAHVPLEERSVYGKIWLDDKKKTFSKRGRLMRMIYYTNLGTIPDETAVKVVLRQEKTRVGSLDEEFLQRLKKGDLFVLGGKMYRFAYAKGMKAFVDRSYATQPTIPSWFSEQLPLSFDLAMQINDFRKTMNKALDSKSEEEITSVLRKELKLDAHASKALHSYFKEQKDYLQVPTHERIVVEEFENFEGVKFFLFHTLFGRRVNDAMSRYFAYILTRDKKISVGITINDNGFALQVPKSATINLFDLKKAINPLSVRETMERSLEGSELLKRKFRHVAGRSFLILRKYKGHSKSVGRQQLSAHILFSTVKGLGRDFPVIKETYREILEDYMDLNNAESVLEKIKTGDVHFVHEKVTTPSSFAHQLVTLGYNDIMFIKDKKEFLRYLHESVLRQIEQKEKGVTTWNHILQKLN